LVALEEPGGVRVYLDRFLRHLADEMVIDWEPGLQKFWLNHPYLDR
jgi:hypothetical protein